MTMPKRKTLEPPRFRWGAKRRPRMENEIFAYIPPKKTQAFVFKTHKKKFKKSLEKEP
jgi:hypothetical protein